MNKNPIEKKSDTIKIIQPKIEQTKEFISFETRNNYTIYVICLFILFVLSCFVISVFDISCVIKFLMVVLSAIIIEDIHHTVKFIWNI
jgi:uncharacterized Tic20 family protein